MVLFLLFVLALFAFYGTLLVKAIGWSDERRGGGACPHAQTYHSAKLYTPSGYGCSVPGCPGKWVDHG